MKEITKLLIIFLLFPTLVWSQNQEKDKKIWNRFAVGMGYDFLGIKFRENINKKTFDFKVRYEFSDRHSIYMNVPFYSNEFNVVTSPYQKLDDKELIKGCGIGYQYNIMEYKGVRLFTGIGFDYYKKKYFNYYHNPIEGKTNEYILYSTTINQEKLYALSPQIGLTYRWKFLEGRLEYKYAFALSKYVVKSYPEPDPDYGESPQSIYPRKNKFRSFDGLNLGLFIHF